MSAHLESELVGLCHRIEQLEARIGRPVPVDNVTRIGDGNRELINRLAKIIEAQQGQIEDIMEMLGELGAG